MSFSDSGYGPGRIECFACKGEYKKQIFWKDEARKELGGFDEFCAACHPNSPSAPLLLSGQVEISREEFNELCLTSGWKLHNYNSSKTRS